MTGSVIYYQAYPIGKVGQQAAPHFAPRIFPLGTCALELNPLMVPR